MNFAWLQKARSILIITVLKMFWQTLIPLLTALGGIVLGFLMSQLGDYLQNIRADKRILKRVLFNQLDIWVEMKKADVETFVPLLIGKFQQALVKRGVQPEQVEAAFAASIKPLTELFRNAKLAAPEDLKDRYEESVDQLAEIDPLLAYQLSGRPRTDFNQVIDSLMSKAVDLEAQIQNPSPKDGIDRFASFVKDYGQRKIFTNMENDIVDVARQISYLTAFRTRTVLKRLTTNLAEDMERDLDEFLDSLISHLTAEDKLGHGDAVHS